MMIDREKVIQALQRRSHASERCENPCAETGYCHYSYQIIDGSGEPIYPFICNKKQICEDSLALLKAQEPRVMTLEEALEAEYVYLDVRLHSSLQCKCCILIKDEDGDIVPLNKGFWGSLEGEDYGIDWRCWTSRPDKATREATPWE